MSSFLVTDALKAGHQTPAGKTQSGVKICPAAHWGEDEGVRGDRREMLDWGAQGFAPLHIQHGPGGPLALLCFHSQSSSKNVSLASRASEKTTMLEGGGQDPHLFLVFFSSTCTVMVFDCQCCTSEGPQRVPFGADGAQLRARLDFSRCWTSSWLKQITSAQPSPHRCVREALICMPAATGEHPQ